VKTVTLTIALVLAVAVVAAGLLRSSVFVARPANIAEAKTFFDRYVTKGGRVVRTDQGGDTVSEGQAYALLLAVATADRERFTTVWRWTKGNLQRPDGLLGWHWADGRLVDDEPATDADLDTVRALLVAADRFDRPGYRDEARRIARSILAKETATFGERRLVLPGPWGHDRRMFNPSYVSPHTFAMLGRGWDAVADANVAALGDLMTDGALPRVGSFVPGPIEPTTNRGRSVYDAATSFAILAAATLISWTLSAKSYSVWTTSFPPKVFVSTQSAPASKYRAWMSATTSGRERLRTSEFPSWPQY
jgi:hypothetical protein